MSRAESLGDVLRRELRRCRNCGTVGALWGPETVFLEFHCGMVVHGVCSQRCNDVMAEAFAAMKGNP